MAVHELHISINGVISAVVGTVSVRVSFAVGRDDADHIYDQATLDVALKSGGVYLTPAQLRAAIIQATKDLLADPSGWNLAGPFDAAYLYGDVNDAS